MIEPTREIFGNIAPNLQLAFYALSVLATLIFCYGIYRRVAIYRAGRAEPFPTAFGQRLTRFLMHGLGLKGLRHDPLAFVMHHFIMWGFIVLFIGTVIVAIEHHLKLGIYRGSFYLTVSFLLDLFGLLFLIGLAMAAYRRWWVQRERFRQAPQDFGVLALLFIIGASGFLLEGLRIAAEGFPNWERWSFVGYLLAGLFGVFGLDASAPWQGHLFVWWAHALLALAFIALLPYTKLLHMFTSPAHISVASPLPKGALAAVSLEEVEERGTVGLASVAELAWRHRLALDACTRCARCQVVCPAYQSGTPLTPMGLIQKMRSHLGKPSAQDTSNRLPGEVISTDELWACTTCRACAESCPVLIDHPELIVGMRRALVADGSLYDASARTTLMNIAGSYNPWGLPREDRGRWAEGLSVKTMKEVGSAEILLWTGCFAAYDPRAQQVARALVKVLQRAGVDFAVLGDEERCTGDTARRIGDEFLFQELAGANLETLSRYDFQHILTTCAHCFNTLQNEYPHFGGRYSVRHHSAFLAELIRQGRLSPKASPQTRLTYHDSCYLGRYNGLYDPPREILASLSGRAPLEMASCRDRSLCCGGGGGHMWMEYKGEKRINQMRLEEARATKAQVVATACPFCLHMLEDAVKAREVEESPHVKDLVELIAERLE